MNNAWNRARLLVTTAWVGSIWTIGYLVAPTLFQTLADQTLAGTIAGQLFQVEAWLSVVCSMLLISIFLFQRKRFPRLIFGMLMCTVFGYFALHPYMVALRELGLGDPDVKWKFGLLHALSSGIYLMQSVLGAMLVLNELTESKSVSSTQ